MKYISSIIIGASLTAFASSLSAATLERSYTWDFETDTVGSALDDSASYNYTTGDSSTTLSAGGTLVLRGNSGSTDNVFAAVGGSTALRMQTALNAHTDDFGVYIGGIDTSDFSPAGQKTVSFSFDVLGSSLSSTTNWEVNLTNGASSAGHSSFVFGSGHVAGDTFDFANTGSTMNTVTGSFTVDAGVGSTLGGLFISGPRNSSGDATMAFGSGASLAIDNISITVVPEPTSYALLLGLAGVATVGFRRSSRKS